MRRQFTVIIHQCLLLILHYGICILAARIGDTLYRGSFDVSFVSRLICWLLVLAHLIRDESDDLWSAAYALRYLYVAGCTVSFPRNVNRDVPVT
jgi:hypothetical protein